MTAGAIVYGSATRRNAGTRKGVRQDERKLIPAPGLRSELQRPPSTH